jgi:hypothetical protein
VSRTLIYVVEHTSYVPRARPILDQKTVLGPGEFTELKAWQVPKSATYPTGVKMRFAYIRLEEGQAKEIYRIDNSSHASLHEHVGEEARPLDLDRWEEVLRHFYEQVEKLRGERP